MGISGTPGADSSRSIMQILAWHDRSERAGPQATDGRVRRVAPATETTPGAGRGTGPPGPITTDFVPDMGADGTPPVGFQPPIDVRPISVYGEKGNLQISSGLQPTLVDRKV